MLDVTIIPFGHLFTTAKPERINFRICPTTSCIKTSLTFKCLIEHLLADFSYSRPLDTYL